MAAADGERAPAYVPAGYKLRAELRGVEVGGARVPGFRNDSTQRVLIYTRALQADDLYHPLTIHEGSVESAALEATEGRPGQVVGLAGGAVRGVYHNGMWKLGPGTDQREFGSLVVHWDGSDIHSVTARVRGRTYAARGSRARGVGLTDLVRTLESLNVF